MNELGLNKLYFNKYMLHYIDKCLENMNEKKMNQFFQKLFLIIKNFKNFILFYLNVSNK